MLDAEGYRRGIRRLVHLRWIAAGAALAGLAAGKALHPQLELAPAFVVAALIAASNLLHLGLARRARSPRLLLLVQFGADLVLLTALLGCVGGIDGPAIPLYLFHALLAALLLERRDALAVAGAGVVLMGSLAVLQGVGAPFPLRDVTLYSAVLGLVPPLAHLQAFVAGQVWMLVFAATVILVLVLPLVREARDYGERLRAAEAETRAEMSTLESILGNAGAMMLLLDGSHRLVWLNSLAAQKLRGLAVGQVRRCYDPAEPMGGSESPQCPSCRVLETGESWRGDYNLPSGGGEPHVLRVYATPLRGAASELRVVELVLDVTDERKLQAQLIEARKSAAIAQLAAGVAHEMNTPLASLAAGIRSLGRMLEADAALAGRAPRAGSLLDDLAAETRRCQRVTQSILGFSRQFRARLDATELDGIIRGALQDLSARRPLAEIEVVAESPSHATPAVRCDPDHLRLVLVNVLVNAVDAVREAHRVKGRVHVSVRLLAEDGCVEIRVSDNGVGMGPDVLERAFDPFFTTKPVGEGSGLGLSVCRGLLDGMGGTISVESEPAKGALVTLRLPVAAPASHREAGSLPPVARAADHG